MKEKLLALINANQGRWVPAIAAFITGGITQLATSKGLELPGETAVLISTTVALLAGWAFEALKARLNTVAVKQIQDALPGITATGTATAPTVAMVERLADRIKAPSDTPQHGLTLEEGQEIKRLLHQICRDRPELLVELRAAVSQINDPTNPKLP